MSWPDLGGGLLAVPVGATEQHGPHLPCTVDTDIAVALCERLAEARPVTVAPPLAYGSSGEHAAFPGTLSIGRQATELVLIELVRSADAFSGVILVSTHGGNAHPLHRAVATLRAEGRHVLPWSPRGRADDTHAGHAETSVMLALRPDAVDLTKAEPGNTTPLPQLYDQLRTGGVAEVSPNGVLGDPVTATATEGKHILTTWTQSLLTAVDTWTVP